MDINLAELSEFIKGYEGENKIALFDMDGTMIEGDACEFITAIAIQEKIIDYNFSKYMDLCEIDIRLAYRDIIYPWVGFIEYDMIKFIDSVIDSHQTTVMNNKELIICKKKNEIEEIIDILKENDFEIGVVSASQKTICDVVLNKFYNLENDNINGVKLNKIDGRFIKEIEEPAPILEGKKAIVEMIYNQRPAICFGDSQNDKWFFESTDKNGLNVVIANTEKFNKIKSITNHNNLKRFSL